VQGLLQDGNYEKEERPKQRLISRKVFFYKVNAGVHYDTGEPLEIDFRRAIQHLSTMPFTSSGRYLDTDDGNPQFGSIDQ
jgi:hypothetical protein